MSCIYQLDNTLDYVYKKMAEHIELRIESGELKPNTPLPAERRLADEYGVSLGTARRATELLRERQLVFTLRSKGTFVTNRPIEPNHGETDPRPDGFLVDQAQHAPLVLQPDFVIGADEGAPEVGAAAS
ncbi:winged helix-turn-helix domain-containing protein [Amycolatopsis taiwanensis]|uniref:winged helix-turn-helix domain-containing protein n=1 Tax=Amycolatopsis taiwanensis TaxID=342230 RepID=UPI0004B8E150